MSSSIVNIDVNPKQEIPRDSYLSPPIILRNKHGINRRSVSAFAKTPTRIATTFSFNFLRTREHCHIYTLAFLLFSIVTKFVSGCIAPMRPSLAVLATAVLQAAVGTASTLTPPVLPLTVRSPYLSTWLGNARDAPWELWPMFYTGEEIGLSVMAQVPNTGSVYPLVGKPHDSLGYER